MLLAVLLTGGATSLLVTLSSRGVLRENVFSRNLATAVAAGDLASQFVQVAEGSLDHLSVGPLFGASVRAFDTAEAEGHLEQLMQTSGRFDSVSVYSPEGLGWASGLKSDWQFRGGSVADREWFVQVVTLREPYLGLPVVSRETGHTVIPYAIPMFAEDGRLISVLVGNISLLALSGTVAGIERSESTRLSLVDSRAGGLVVAASDASLILQPVAQQEDVLRQMLAEPRGTIQTQNERRRGQPHSLYAHHRPTVAGSHRRAHRDSVRAHLRRHPARAVCAAVCS